MSLVTPANADLQIVQVLTNTVKCPPNGNSYAVQGTFDVTAGDLGRDPPIPNTYYIGTLTWSVTRAPTEAGGCQNTGAKCTIDFPGAGDLTVTSDSNSATVVGHYHGLVVSGQTPNTIFGWGNGACSDDRSSYHTIGGSLLGLLGAVTVSGIAIQDNT